MKGCLLNLFLTWISDFLESLLVEWEEIRYNIFISSAAGFVTYAQTDY